MPLDKHYITPTERFCFVISLVCVPKTCCNGFILHPALLSEMLRSSSLKDHCAILHPSSALHCSPHSIRQSLKWVLVFGWDLCSVTHKTEVETADMLLQWAQSQTSDRWGQQVQGCWGVVKVGCCGVQEPSTKCHRLSASHWQSGDIRYMLELLFISKYTHHQHS